MSDPVNPIASPLTKLVGSGGGVGGLKPRNNFENDGATSQALIRCLVLYCFKNNYPTNLQVLPTALHLTGVKWEA